MDSASAGVKSVLFDLYGTTVDISGSRCGDLQHRGEPGAFQGKRAMRRANGVTPATSRLHAAIPDQARC
jgi:hypothetical protein